MTKLFRVTEVLQNGVRISVMVEALNPVEAALVAGAKFIGVLTAEEVQHAVAYNSPVVEEAQC